MGSRKNGLLLKILLLLLIVCSVVAAGVTYGRYHSSIAAESFNVTAVSANAFGIYGGVLSSENAQSAWPSLDSGWSMKNDSASLNFFVTNGDSLENFSQRDRTYSVMIVSAAPDHMLNVTLSYVDEEGRAMELPANPERIEKGSVLYQAYGEGWTYNFLDMSAEEVQFLLKGGTFSYRNFTLNVSGEADPSLISVVVTSNIVAEK